MAENDDFDGDDDGGDWFADAGAALAAQRPDQAKRAEAGEGAKRKRGRPKGSLNRKTRDFEEFYRSQGFTDPLTGMARFVTVDPVALQAWFVEHERAKVAVGKKLRRHCPTLWDIVKEQHTVMSQLAPYLHGKKPVQLEVIDERLPMLIVNLGTDQLETGKTIAGQKALSLGQQLGGAEGEKANEINDSDDGEA